MRVRDGGQSLSSMFSEMLRPQSEKALLGKAVDGLRPILSKKSRRRAVGEEFPSILAARAQ